MTTALLLFSLSFAHAECVETSCPGDLDAVLSVAPSGVSTATPGADLESDQFLAVGLREDVFEAAKTAFRTAWEAGDTERTVFTIIDYSMDSNQKRLWVIDMATGEVLFQEHVAHGVNSGAKRVERMSNVEESRSSNLGLLRTAETYYGRHGYSLRLDGLEPGFNDNARSRHIVIHAASYVTDAFIEQYGRAGRSWGCPALDPDVAHALIDRIKGGSLVFGYYPDESWLEKSSYLDAE
ncbi:MAG: murein L,D-transpeptidase catalytic domain family protein [Myxococcota bacterium]|nr:murein L,D-transpeptidase catalytic domain family protein [Myxococcota bacterium]